VSAVLYRCRTRTDRLCPCGRVARELRRRGVEFEERRVARGEREEVDALTGQVACRCSCWALAKRR
jgi:hypothetical protein